MIVQLSAPGAYPAFCKADYYNTPGAYRAGMPYHSERDSMQGLITSLKCIASENASNTGLVVVFEHGAFSREQVANIAEAIH